MRIDPTAPFRNDPTAPFRNDHRHLAVLVRRGHRHRRRVVGNGLRVSGA